MVIPALLFNLSLFEKLVPAMSDTDKRFKALLEIPVGERFFHFEYVLSEASFATKYFEATMSSRAIVKQEAPTPVTAKPRIPTLRSNTLEKKRISAQNL
ncbi:hypothetical protein L1987_52156 [Smallanthus sonchifolius]|uniref:Uncharacterized protein n=1 Tax=Smallanthus sonchifolius TaxID=185202 RepID=A0ACB9ESX9_9ASTR|nr:hypothetical protein L1987_52156 [Smallanthus sonchifolius]